MSTNNNPYNNRQVGNDKSQMTNVLQESNPPYPPQPMMPPMPPRGQWQRMRGIFSD